MKKLLIPVVILATFVGACSGDTVNPVVVTSDSITAVSPDTSAVADELLGDTAVITTVEFESLDGLMITADKSVTPSHENWMLLCHQAGFSRGEYIETACEFNEIGFNTLAIDQRSGQETNGIANETVKRATDAGLPTNYSDAEQDIRAAIDYLYELSGGKPIIVCGSSYSSALVLKVGAGNEKVRAILSFSPGEYYRGESVQAWATAVHKPLFATSSKSESADLTVLLENMDDQFAFHFIPEQEGVHGSRALWATQNNNQEYWDALNLFLSNLAL
jgi:hypothetical protein